MESNGGWCSHTHTTHTHACMHACTYIRAHTHACTHAYIRLRAHTCTYVYAHAVTCTHMHTCMYTLANTHASMRICPHTCIYVYASTHTCTHAHMYVRTHACTYVCAHRHTNTYLPYIEKKRKERRIGSVLLRSKQGIVGFYRNELSLHWAFSDPTETLNPGWLSPDSGALSSTYSRHCVEHQKNPNAFNRS